MRACSYRLSANVEADQQPNRQQALFHGFTPFPTTRVAAAEDL
jgi:hypothetical protein